MTPQRPPLTIELKLDDGATAEVKLTYGLQQDLQRVLPDPSAAIEMVLFDQGTRDYLIRRCMTPLKKMVTDEKELIAAEDLQLSDPDELDRLLQWVTDHVIYFFAKSAGSLKAKGDQLKALFPPAKTPQEPSSPGSAT